ncbi:MAG: porphobilinogen synthase, partial [Acidobacteriota bacterium]|nr:porphobilinogen synthase [Acidobacteriota bacterium]
MAFPQTRLRRMRASQALRGLVRETDLSPGRLVLPLFVAESATAPEPIAGMPGIARLPISAAVEEAREAARLGLAGVLLFGVPAEKDAEGSAAHDDDGAVQLAVGAIKRAVPELSVMTDVCLCEYTDHGHCGL